MLAYQALLLPSGDLLLDRRLDWARGLIERGEAAAAARLLDELVEQAPDFLVGWLLLGEARERMSAHPQAITAFRRALALDPENRLGAALRLARLGDIPPGAAMSKAYLRTLFDQYAQRFDEELNALSYRGPALLMEAIDRVVGARTRFSRVADLGCGTGLMGAAIRPRTDEIVGADLSPAMIAKARAKKIYDRLVVGDLLDFLATERGPFDLVLAADVFVYFADLKPVLGAIARKLMPRGCLAFSLERHAAGDVALNESLRYAHGEAHVRTAAERAGLDVLHLARVSTRTEKRKPVDGWIVVLAPSQRET